MGASWVSKEILEQKPGAELSVYVVWVPQFGAQRSDVDTSLFHDRRAKVYWDTTGAVGSAVAGNSDVYDVYALYDGDEELRWDTTVASGGTVIGESEHVKQQVEKLLS